MVGKLQVACTTIDAAFAELGIDGPDFIKIDTQGTELDVLKGAERALATCLALEVEVEFQPLYEGAALFRDIDAYVSGFGFELFDLRRTFFRRAVSPPIEQRKGQMIYGDALYFRDWRRLSADRNPLLRLAGILLAYGYADVVTEIIKEADALAEADRQELADICAGLVSADPPGAKDTFTGSGFHLV